MIPVTKPFLPSREEYDRVLDGIWSRNWLTNNGPVLNELELRLKDYLGLDHLAYVNNGTIAIQIAIRALEIKGEIITTPFSYVATVSSAVWEGCTPVFADIDPHTFNIDPKKIQTAITKETKAILATHVYGNPCDVEEIQRIAKENNLAVIYDAAHAFGTLYKEKSLFAYGDISTTSFHATKLFHTVEGGAVITREPELLKKISWLRNFGHNGPYDFHGCGINGKNSEFHSAMGLCVLHHIDKILEHRKGLSAYYKKKMGNLRVTFQKIRIGAKYNHAYFPIVMENEGAVVKAVKLLEENYIFPRRYFFPSLEKLPYVKTTPMPVSDDLSRRVLCLPLYHELREEDIDFIVRLLLRAQNN
jgi:dTDP-4-amino-4,6-dideoxygalactose transaminase